MWVEFLKAVQPPHVHSYVQDILLFLLRGEMYIYVKVDRAEPEKLIMQYLHSCLSNW